MQTCKKIAVTQLDHDQLRRIGMARTFMLRPPPLMALALIVIRVMTVVVAVVCVALCRPGWFGSPSLEARFNIMSGPGRQRRNI